MDAVGNILAERQQEHFPLGGGVSLSLLLHAAVAGVLIASAFARPARLASPRAVSVRLMPAGALQGGAAVAVPAQPEPEPQKPKIEKNVEPPPPPSSKAVLLPVKDKKPEPPAPAPRAADAKKAEPAKPAAGNSQGSATALTINTAGTGVGIGGARFDQTDFQFSYYGQRIVVAIAMQWFKPAQVVPVSPVVHFQIERDGTVTDPEIEVSSGLPFVDRAALRAVIAASPLPPLPPEYSGTRLGVHVNFEK